MSTGEQSLPHPPLRHKSKRRKTRDFLLQALYRRLLSGAEVRELQRDIEMSEFWQQLDHEFYRSTLAGVVDDIAGIEAGLAGALDRPIAEVSPVERAILQIGLFELIHRPDTPLRVIINEAIELGKTFGGTDGHKFVNGVLDRLAQNLRPDEAAKAGRHGVGI
jgi:N utilization substance protein B